jgi:L-malate glycosyltransferase
MINVLQLIGSFGEGGSERQALQLARLLLDQSRYNVHIACLDRKGALLNDAESLGFREVPEFPLTSFYNSNTVRQLNRFSRYLTEHGIRIVHTHDFYTNVFGMAGATLARVPARIASRRETLGWRTNAQRFVERRAYNLAHAVVTNSEAARRQLIGEGVSSTKISTIHNGLSFDRVTPRTRLSRRELLSSFDMPDEPDSQIVTIIANLRHPVKNYPMFLRAARIVLDANPGTKFVIAGEGELMPSMRKLATELGIDGSVFFLGRCDRVGDLLAMSDICALSSTAEGFSNAILEYMAAAKPVVVTDVGGAREAVVDGVTGYLVPSNDHSGMAARIVFMLRNRDVSREMGERGRKTVRARFSCEAQLANTEELYDRIVARVSTTLRQTLNNGATSVSPAPLSKKS